MMKEEFANVKFESLLQQTERLGVCDMRLTSLTSFSSRHGGRNSVVPQTANTYGVLIDEAQDITVVEKFITFVKYKNGMVKRRLVQRH